MQQTTKYQFNLIESTDPIQTAPLNENMEKVELALSDRLHMALGHYQGSGEYGVKHPNILNFDFRPQFLFIWSSGPYISIATRDDNTMVTRVNSSGRDIYVTWGDQSVSWYGNDNYEQLNQTTYTYHYLAVG